MLGRILAVAVVGLTAGVPLPLVGVPPSKLEYGANQTIAPYIISGGVILAPQPKWCGRKCNCGTGQQQTIETEKGERVTGYVPPSGDHCACAEVYRCDVAEVGAPVSAPSTFCPSSNKWTIDAGGGSLIQSN